ncbi:hypothetical protein DTO207G8_6729 [Paecilomyces variotii]|nr:hypothetical protein DTO207G8_6729 [Paecilomyces variotii]
MGSAPTEKVDPSAGSPATLQLQNTGKRDTLVKIEKKYQAKWQEDHVFESNAPSIDEVAYGSISDDELHEQHPKYYATFACPYMNWILHAGHSFTVSKVEFTVGFQRMIGKRTLFPLGFHGTGMAIKACADKLINKIRRFGKYFEGYKKETESSEESGMAVAPIQDVTRKDMTKFSGKKSKAAAKTIKAKYQFLIMLSIGIPLEDIHKFADGKYWLEFFPELCARDLKDFGARIDWRRHPKYGQPCMDHSRSEGETLGPVEYLKVRRWSPVVAKVIEGTVPQDASVYFIPATLRPETMYGQVCCFVGPNIRYGIFKVSDTEYYVCTKRAAWDMAFQGTFFGDFPRVQSELQPVVDLPGSAFVGTLVNAPLSVHTEGIRILPMDSVSATKGTGVVTCVPSDSPDDYTMIQELIKKPEYYSIEKEWAELKIIPVIETPTYRNLTAKKLIQDMKINSPKDTAQLDIAKKLAYSKGFYKGKMLTGEFTGQSV